MCIPVQKYKFQYKNISSSTEICIFQCRNRYIFQYGNMYIPEEKYIYSRIEIYVPVQSFFPVQK